MQFVQTLNDEHVVWNEERKLHLNGFKGHSLCKLMTWTCKKSKVVMMVAPLLSSALFVLPSKTGKELPKYTN